jgi:hypothetical protein
MNLKESIIRILREEINDFQNMDWIIKAKVSLKNSAIFFEPVINEEEYNKIVEIIEESCDDEIYCAKGSFRTLRPFNSYDYLHHLVITLDGKVLFGGTNSLSKDSEYHTRKSMENYIISQDSYFNNPNIIDGREYFNI